MHCRRAVRLAKPSATSAACWGLGLGLSLFSVLASSTTGANAANPVPGAPAGSTFYSTAAPPADFSGPVPDVIDVAVAPVAPAPEERELAAEPMEMPPTRLANASTSPAVEPVSALPPAQPAETLENVPAPKPAAADPIAQALAIIGESRARYQQIQDYTCTFFKRERVNGRMTPQFIMAMKFRAKPHSVYFKFVKPTPGREAIYIAGRNGGKALVHDVGIGKLLAGTLALDPRSRRAMVDNRHPITDAGLGHMIDELSQRWQSELRRGETVVAVHQVNVGTRPCTMIESTHPRKSAAYLFHKVKVYVDQENGLPIRFEAYDWPRHAGAAPELVEEYIYANLRLNPNLRESEFDPSNPQYSFGRF